MTGDTEGALETLFCSFRIRHERLERDFSGNAMHLALGHSIEEVAAAVGAPGNTVRSRIRLAKEALRARIDGDPRLAELLATEGRA